MSDSGQVARLVAEIADLRQKLADGDIKLRAATHRAETAEAALAEARAAAGDTEATKARLTELEALLTDPPAASGVTLVHYLAPDGSTILKRRYRASDGSKHLLLPDALRQESKLGLMRDLRIGDREAETILDKGSAVVAHITAANLK